MVRLSFGGGNFAEPAALHDLIDLTLDPAYSSICGYTEDDLDTVFAPELSGLDREQVREWYNGYSWLGQVSGRGATDPPDRGRVQLGHPQRHGIRRGRRLTAQPAGARGRPAGGIRGPERRRGRFRDRQPAPRRSPAGGAAARWPCSFAAGDQHRTWRALVARQPMRTVIRWLGQPGIAWQPGTAALPFPEAPDRE